MKKQFVAIVSAILLSFGGLLPASAAPAVPAQVTAQSATEVGGTPADAAVEISWTRDPAVDIYDVVATATGQPNVDPVSLVCQSSPCKATVFGLAGGVTYDFRVTARLVEDGSSNFAVVSFLTRSVTEAPSPVSALGGVGQVSLSWTAPRNTGGSTITSYRITTADGKVSQTVAGDQTSANVTGLTPGATYSFRIAAVNALGSSGLGLFQQATVLNVPDAPSAPRVAALESSITVTWTAPASTGGSPITEYRVYLRRGGADVGAPQIVQTGTTATFNSLPGGAYRAQVIAVNAAGTSPRSVESNEGLIQGASLLPNVPVFIPGAIASVQIGTSPTFTVQVAAGTTFRLSVSANPAGACRVQGGQVQTLAAGTCTITATADETLVYQAGSNQATFTITATEQTPPNNAGGGGGGGGGGGFFPPAAPPQPAVTTNPIPQGSGLVVLDADGKPVTANPVVSADKQSLELIIGTIAMVLRSQAGIQFSPEGKATAASGSKLEFAASGFQPDSSVAGYLIPQSSLTTSGFRATNASAIALGTSTVNADGVLAFEAALTAPSGDYILQFSGLAAGGSAITLALQATIAGSSSSGLKTWAKRMPGNTQAKLYAKSIVGVGKVTFRLNGKEIAWVNAKDSKDRKLRIVGSDNYLVRTVKLAKGKNTLEVFVDGKRTTRTVYSRK